MIPGALLAVDLAVTVMLDSEPESRSSTAGRYSTKEVARLANLSVAQVRYLIRTGLFSPSRGERGEFRFSFQDLVLLRTARDLRAAGLSTQRIRLTLDRLSHQLPERKPLTAVRIRAEGSEVVVQDGQETWHPDTGQIHLDFGDDAPVASEAPVPLKHHPQVEDHAGAAEYAYLQGCRLEDSDPAEASRCYSRAVELDPRHTDAWLNLGRIRHEAGQLTEAERCYRRVLELDGFNSVAAYNLGVVLEDQGREEEAVGAYERVVELEGTFKEAHFNLACLYERLGDRGRALQHLKAYRKLEPELFPGRW